MEKQSLFNFKIVYENGMEIDMKNTPFWVQYFRIDSVSSASITETIENRHGELWVSNVLKPRQIKIGLQVLFSYDQYSFDFIRDEANQIFTPLEQFYIIRDLQPHKRALVTRTENFDYMTYYDWTDGELEIVLDMYQPLFESVGTTLNSLTFNEEAWQVGQAKTTFEDVKYEFNTANIRYYNAGDVALDPRHFPLCVSFRGDSTNLEIKNKTNGTYWKYNGTTRFADEIIIDGVRSFKNGVNIFPHTSHTLLSFESGFNDITVIGANGEFTVDFDNRFYYF